MGMHATERLAERLCAINWEMGFDRTLSRVRLMSEYLRRSAHWADALGCVDRWPFFDIAAEVDPGVRADAALVARVEEHLANDGPSWTVVRNTCLWALHWAALPAGAQVSGRISGAGADDPFAPLLLMYERGGGFTLSTGFIDIDAAGVRRRTWRDHLKPEPVVSLDPAVLDELDRRGPA